MYNSLSGRISGHDFPLVFLQNQGIEWELEVSAATFQQVMAADHQQEHRLFVHLHVREDLLKLFGFWSRAERRAFLQLNTVSGIGPRQALKILSGTSVASLMEQLEHEDIDALTRIPGLGRKTAQKMILQLKGHLVTEDAGPGGRAQGSTEDELLNALVDMGFDRSRARNTLADIRAGMDKPDEQDMFRRAIVALSGT